MKNYKILCIKICILLGFGTFTQCASSQKMDKIAPIEIKNAYFEKWKSDSDSGFTIYISVDENSTVTLKHVYFKHKKIVLVKENNTSSYIGKHTYTKNDKDLIMAADPKKEFGNTLPAGIQRIPYRLKANECVIVYTKEGVEGHFKIENVPEKKE